MKTAHILLVDDDPISNKWLTAALTAANYQVSSVEDAKTAWQLLTTRTHTYQLVIIDRMMFGMSGMDLLRQIQMSPSLKKIPVIIQTGECRPEEHIAAIAAGAVDLLYKPIATDLLLKVVNKALST